MEKLAIGVIIFYQKIISPLKPPTCRFYPTCSHYTKDAIVKYGASKGLKLSYKRIMKCHPFHPGGYDPLPEIDVSKEEYC